MPISSTEIETFMKIKNLQRKQFLKTLDETEGAWIDKNHPELRTAKDVE
jgi:hypothetical protein